MNVWLNTLGAFCLAPLASAVLAQAPAYRSAWTDYRSFTADEPQMDWRAANDALREPGHGGGMAVQGESQAPSRHDTLRPASPPQPAPATQAPRADHSGHAGHAGHAGHEPRKSK
jgi:hypothetical protein